MFVRMAVLIVATCILATLVLERGWLMWLPAGAALFTVLKFRKHLGA